MVRLKYLFYKYKYKILVRNDINKSFTVQRDEAVSSQYYVLE